jgi:hypothetical protein
MISYVFDLIGSFEKGCCFKIRFKGIVSRDLEVCFWCHSIDLKFLHLTHVLFRAVELVPPPHPIGLCRGWGINSSFQPQAVALVMPMKL